jgi:hypothetical protein
MSAEFSEREFAEWAEALRAEYDAFLRQSWAAMRAARQGQWIEDTEEQVHQAGEVFRRKALEKLLQMQVEAGQGSFSPSTRPGLHEQGPARGGASDSGGTRGSAPAGVAPGRRRSGGARR